MNYFKTTLIVFIIFIQGCSVQKQYVFQFDEDINSMPLKINIHNQDSIIGHLFDFNSTNGLINAKANLNKPLQIQDYKFCMEKRFYVNDSIVATKLKNLTPYQDTIKISYCKH